MRYCLVHCFFRKKKYKSERVRDNNRKRQNRAPRYMYVVRIFTFYLNLFYLCITIETNKLAAQDNEAKDI